MRVDRIVITTIWAHCTREDAPVIMASGLINTTSGLESTAKRDLLMSRAIVEPKTDKCFIDIATLKPIEILTM